MGPRLCISGGPLRLRRARRERRGRGGRPRRSRGAQPLGPRRRQGRLSGGPPCGRCCRVTAFGDRPTLRNVGSAPHERITDSRCIALSAAYRIQRCHGRERAAPTSVSQPKIRRRDPWSIDIHRSIWRNSHRGSNQQCRCVVRAAGSGAPAGRLARGFQLSRPHGRRRNVRCIDAHSWKGPSRSRPSSPRS